MNLLAVDTAGETLLLAVLAGGKTITSARRRARPHDETLIPSADRLLARAGLEPEDLDAVAAASGPGRFTGIRVGMAYAAVLARHLDIPALAVSRFEAAARLSSAERLCVALPGFRDEKFYQLFRGAKPEAPPVWASPADWESARKDFEARGIPVEEGGASAAGLALAAADILKDRKRPPFEPLYLKPASYEHKRSAAR